MNLSYSMTAAIFQHNEKRHPQEVIKALGIEYDRAECFATSDHWVFYNCRNVPEELPAFISRFEENVKMPNCPACIRGKTKCTLKTHSYILADFGRNDCNTTF